MNMRIDSIPERLRIRRHVTDEGCWEWIGSKTRDGYGMTSTPGRRSVYVHRLSWEVYRGPIPDGLEVDHLCRNHSCFNPDHLEPVTRAENVRRGVAPERTRAWWAAMTHCPNGHEYTEENVGWRNFASGGRSRMCRICNRAMQRRYRAKRKAAQS